MSEVFEKCNIPRSSLRDHVIGKCRGKKIGPKTILSMDKETQLFQYIELIVKWKHAMTPIQLKAKVAKITQDKITPFKNGVPGDS